jgi:apolipoprotein N-acyltransferase
MQRGMSVKRMWLYAFAAGLAFWLVLASWMYVFHVFALFTAIPILAVYFSLPFLFLSVWQRISRDRFSFLDPLIFAFFWVGVEYFRFTGFLGYPWGTLGYSQTSFLPVLQIADIAGVWGVSFLIIFVNGVFAYLIRREYRRRKRFLLYALITVLTLSFVYGGFRLGEEPRGPEYRVQLVQAFVDPAEDWASLKYRQTMEKITEMTVRAGQEDTDLIIWSETLSSPAGMYYYKYLRQAPIQSTSRQIGEWFIDMPARAGKPVLLTAPHREAVSVTNASGGMGLEMQSYNAAFLVTPSRNVVDSYYKINLVPFGEWFPYKKEFPWVAKVLTETTASDFTPGERYTVFKDDGADAAFSVLICFEDIFGELCRQFILRGAEFLINTTNDYWSKSIQSQEQHAAMAILRAIESRRYLVRAANTGVTCVIDAWGRTRARLDNHVEGILSARIFLMRGYGESFYTKHGDYLGIAGAYACGLALLGSIFLLLSVLVTRKTIVSRSL